MTVGPDDIRDGVDRHIARGADRGADDVFTRVGELGVTVDLRPENSALFFGKDRFYHRPQALIAVISTLV